VKAIRRKMKIVMKNNERLMAQWWNEMMKSNEIEETWRNNDENINEENDIENEGNNDENNNIKRN
jgi:hypothetical protein